MKTLSISEETKDRFDKALQIFNLMKGTSQTQESFVSFLLDDFWDRIDEDLLQDRLESLKNEINN